MQNAQCRAAASRAQGAKCASIVLTILLVALIDIMFFQHAAAIVA